MVFPVLDLPSLGLEQVLRGFTSVDLFEMHQCSIKTGNALKQLDPYVKVIKLSVDFSRFWVDIRGLFRYQVCAANGDLPEKTRKFGGQDVPIDDSKETNINVYFPEAEMLQGTMKIAIDLIQALGVKELQTVFIGEHTPAQEVLHWLQNNQIKIENFNMDKTAAGNKDALAQVIYSNDFFDKVSKNYVSLLETSPDFTPKAWIENSCITLFKLQLLHANWFTLDHLMRFHSGIVILNESTLSSSDINKFLTFWFNGDYTRLEYLTIKLVEGKEFDIRQIIAGITNPEKIRVDGGYEIIEMKQRAGEKRAGELKVNATKKNELNFSLEAVVDESKKV